MIAGLKHLVKDNFQDIVESSYLNCHVKGVHSYMLIDYPGRSVRVFYATAQHDLGKNIAAAVNRSSNAEPMSVAFHSHRRNLTLEVIQGTLTNITAFEDDGCYDPQILNKFKYESRILDGKMKFVKKGKGKLANKGPQKLNKGDYLHLPAQYFHTVAVDPYTTCAWLVFEGAEDPGYTSECYSNADLENISDEGLYIKPTEQQAQLHLSAIGLY